MEFQRFWLARAFVNAGEQQKAAIAAYQVVGDLFPGWQDGQLNSEMMAAALEDAMRRLDTLIEGSEVVAKFAQAMTSPDAQAMAAQIQAYVETVESRLNPLVEIWQQRPPDPAD